MAEFVKYSHKNELKQNVNRTGNSAAHLFLQDTAGGAVNAKQHASNSGQAEAIVNELWEKTPIGYRVSDWYFNTSGKLRIAVDLHISAAASMGCWMGVNQTLSLIELSMKNSIDLIDRYAK